MDYGAAPDGKCNCQTEPRSRGSMTAFGPNRTLDSLLRCCGCSPHCRHSLREQSWEVSQPTICGIKPPEAGAAFLSPQFVRKVTASRHCSTTSPKRPSQQADGRKSTPVARCPMSDVSHRVGFCLMASTHQPGKTNIRAPIDPCHCEIF